METGKLRRSGSTGIQPSKATRNKRACRRADGLPARTERRAKPQHHQVREGWEEAFRAAGPAVHDELLLEGLPPNRFDKFSWHW